MRVAGRRSTRGLVRVIGWEGASGKKPVRSSKFPPEPKHGTGFFVGQVAQLVEHTAENRGVAGSIPALATEVPAREVGAVEGP
jgi:hypothetical protein